MIAGLWKLVYKPLIRLLKKTKELLDSNDFLCGRLLDGSVFPDSTLDFFDTWTSDGSSALWMLVLTACSLASRNIFEHKFHGWFFDSLNA
ncbi:unnamed protein product [Rhizophagus irregularis]|nr:unnamed protein product [Rhizophagus irregularis]